MSSGDMAFIFGVGSAFLTLATFLVLHHRHKLSVQNTICKAIEHGDQLSPEVLDKFGTFRSEKIVDLRRGLALMSIGIAAIMMGLLTDQLRHATAIAMFPLLLGTSFVLVWKFGKYHE